MNTFHSCVNENMCTQNQKSGGLKTWHGGWGLKLYKVCINDDPGLVFTPFTFFFFCNIPRFVGYITTFF